jgi:hypothetical protein
LEDVIEMLGFVPPLSDKKKKRDKDDTEVEEEVGTLFRDMLMEKDIY